ncbi:DUF998 domain-containing protein [Actinotalea ferrariae]|uniref:DUF998 domain-containing protein n=1 Tax=Actinotalea ferrariae TaxID=1386098 RepID=UPI001C8BBA43|nr:DUF998 domain-containing protein [Actinotalea ferrariae]MBX9243513.1 DUF998 domain-containing protein [Actinotalea ferrariae]
MTRAELLGPPAWTLASAAAAPVAMIGGWTLAAAAQERFDPVRETISALAATDATAPWIMTAGLAGTGLAHLVTAAGLRAARRPGRVLHAVGGLATLAVAALPVDVASRAHGVAAGIAFVALSLWPAFAWRRGERVPVVLRPVVGLAAAVVLLALLVLFVLELQGLTPDGGAATGATERWLAGAQALWPLAVVLGLRRTRRSGPLGA